MTEAELLNENLKLQIELEKAKTATAERTAESKKPTLALWTVVVSTVAGPLVVLFGQWVNARYQIAATTKAEATTIATSNDVKDVAGASALGWKAYNSKDESDEAVAAKTLQKAEEILAKPPPKTPPIPLILIPK